MNLSEMEDSEAQNSQENEAAEVELTQELQEPQNGAEPMETQITAYSAEFSSESEVFEVGRYHSCNPTHYTRGCLFSPDGTCLLTSINQNGVKVFELPTDLYSKDSVTSARPITKLSPAIHITEGLETTVYDMVWYPQMSSHFPETCSFLVSRQNEPIKSYDAFDGSLRCSYRGYDAVDEVEAAYSLCYSPAGDRIFAGYKKSVKIFKHDSPGRDYETIPTTFASSALAAGENIVCCGSWNTGITIFDPRTPNFPTHSMRGSHQGGITYLKLLTDSCLISGARKDSKLIMWDLRQTSSPYFVFKRDVSSNQRIYFDVSPEGKWLATGGSDGNVRIWNTFEAFADNSVATKEITFRLHDDCCNGVSFHPFLPVIATSSGQFHFDLEEDEDGKEDCDSQNFVTMWWIS